ncbi:MAG: AEC family transporter [Rhodospirillaceae bacterium]|nr:AEC family transporter [Rhodospirillaceae bacterium]
MFLAIAPVFLAILIGLVFGLKNRYSSEAERLINDYALYIAFPAYLFLAVAGTDPSELMNGFYIVAALAGVIVTYICGLFAARLVGITGPNSCIVAMGASFGNTGYMGIPLITAVLGHEAAPAASLIWVMHNIPVLVAVILTYDLADGKRRGLLSMGGKAFTVAFSNPLTLAVLAGLGFSFFRIPLPDTLANFARMLGAAAGPTALFAMGLGLSKIRLRTGELTKTAKAVSAVVLLKTILFPLVTFLIMVPFVGFNFGNVWFMSAIIMASMPVGVLVYVFGARYGFFETESSIAIIASQLLVIATLPALFYLHTLPPS